MGELVTPILREVPKPDKSYERISVRSHAKGTFHQIVEDPKKVAMDKLYVVKENDLIVNITFAWEHAIAVATKEDDGLLVSHRFPTFLIDKSDVNFIRFSVSQESFRRKMELISPGGAGRNRVLNKKNFIKLEMNVPLSIEEQTKIGDFFKQLDRTIALHQEKRDKLRRLKKAFLQLIFPKSGETEPQLRFANFVSPWEQRKLGDISEVRTGPFGSTLHADDYVENGTPIITTEHFKNGLLPTNKVSIPQVSKEDVIRLQGYVLHTGDIVFSRVGSVDINAVVTEYHHGWLFSGRVLRVRTNYDLSSEYMHYELSTERVRNDVISRAVGQTMPSINTEILNETKVWLPLNHEEQTKIGVFFKDLDHTIALHQTKLEKLQSLKKAYLQKMFI
ncbi:restriction endonuclease subunit S [Sporolactobacillus sp. STSJ-5]|nr:restriction endonuclease subunit S [Sporolactobacillus sp. STSJ-5]